MKKNLIYWLWKEVRGERLRLISICLVGMLRIMLSLSFVWLCKHIVDIATGSHDSVWPTVWMMVAVMIAQMLIGNLTIRIRQLCRIRTTNKLQHHLFGHVMRSAWGGKEVYHTGEVVNRLETDVNAVSSMLCDNIPLLLISSFELLAAGLFLFWLQPKLLFTLLCIMPVAVLLSKVFFRIIRRLTKAVREADAAIQGHMQERLQHRILLVALGRVRQGLDGLESLQQRLYDTSYRRMQFTIRSRMFVQTGFMSGYAVVFVWSVLGLQAGTITYGMMTAFLQLVGQVQRPILDMSRYVVDIAQSFTSVERLHDLLQLNTEDECEPDYLAGPVGLRVSGLTFTYEGNKGPTLAEFNHDFKPGTSTAIIGETGAGKSTLLRLLLGLLQSESGSITLYNDERESELNPATRANYRYVPQGNTLLSGTVRQNLQLGNPNATDDEMRDALHLACADFVMERPEGLDWMCAEKGSGLSEGQAQRIAIARALLQKGSILVLDEASSALDVETEQELLRRLTSSNDSQTIIWVTHHLAVADTLQHTIRL